VDGVDAAMEGIVGLVARTAIGRSLRAVLSAGRVAQRF
jgi:hypothetical protein